MHKIYIPQVGGNYADILSYLHVPPYNPDNKEPFILYTSHPGKEYELLIRSAHCDVSRRKAQQVACVISYVPAYDSEEWLNFYASVWSSDVIACDSFCKKELGDLFNEKPWINLDGCSIHDEVIRKPIGDVFEIGIFGDQESNLTKRYDAWLTEANKNDEIGMRLVKDIFDADILLSFEPIGHMLANVYSKKYQFISVPYTEANGMFLDSRNTHTYSKKLFNLISASGAAPKQIINEMFLELTTELLGLVGHSRVMPIIPYSSTVNLYERIYHQMVRAYK